MASEGGEEAALLLPPDDPSWSPDPSQGGRRAPSAPAKRPPTPWLAWPALALSVCAVSSAGAVFRSLGNDAVPPVLLASWRLQATSLVLLPGFLWQLFGMPPGDRARLGGKDPGGGRHPPLLEQPLVILAASGTCLAVHFGSWVWGIAHTTLPHSLLFVSSTPVLIAAGMLALRMPITVGEVLGTAVGMAGAGMIAAGAVGGEGGGRKESASLAGDASSLLGAAAMVGYLAAGRRLRSWLPLFVYVLPVTLLAAAWLALWAWAVEVGDAAGGGAAGSRGVFGWVHVQWLGRVAYLALGPGVMGHTNFNLLLRWVDPLVITLALNLEPLLGSLAGWAAGLSTPPGSWTWAGGVLLLVATSLVSLAASRREGGGGGAGPETPGSTPTSSPPRGGIALRPVLDLFFSPATRRWAQERAVELELETPPDAAGPPPRRPGGTGGGRPVGARRKILDGHGPDGGGGPRSEGEDPESPLPVSSTA